jgi:hypothetical protein
VNALFALGKFASVDEKDAWGIGSSLRRRRPADDKHDNDERQSD